MNKTAVPNNDAPGSLASSDEERRRRKVFVAGATGYLGGHIARVCAARGWDVLALARTEQKAASLAAIGCTPVIARATEPDELVGVMDGVEVVISALGITRQADGFGYMEVDYGANLNLLNEATRAGVERFCYVSVFRGEELATASSLIGAKEAFVRALRAVDEDPTVASRACVIRPTAFFSDMGDFFQMAASGRAWVLGDGEQQVNPISGEDLARVCVATMEGELVSEIEVGGPQVLTMNEIARSAFEALQAPPKISHLPEWLARGVGKVLPWITPRSIHGPVEMFLAMGNHSMVAPFHTHDHGEAFGYDTLSEHFASLAANSEHRSKHAKEPSGAQDR